MPDSRVSVLPLYVLAAVTLATVLPGLSFAQPSIKDYPNKPITVIIPFAPGATDVMSRFYTTEVSRATGWIFTYDYKPGAAGRIGTALAAKAAPDGYSMHGNSATITYGHLMKTKLSYDWRKDFLPLFQMNRTPSILMVNSAFPVKSVAEYIAYGKANPGKINYATVGAGGIVHIIAEFMHSQMGVKVTYIPYKGFGATVSGLLSGEVQATHASYLTHQANIVAGKIRPLALTARNSRLRQLPELKSLAEEGIPEFEHVLWLGLFLPTGVPAAIVNRLSVEFNKASKSEEIAKKLDAIGEMVGGGSPEEFRQFLLIASERLTKVIQDNNIELED